MKLQPARSNGSSHDRIQQPSIGDAPGHGPLRFWTALPEIFGTTPEKTLLDAQRRETAEGVDNSPEVTPRSGLRRLAYSLALHLAVLLCTIRLPAYP